MDEEKKNQSIKCDVDSCKYQDCDCCTLDEIQVGYTDGCHDADIQSETNCESFEHNDKNIKEEE